jgi:hypothetical protein
MEEPQTFNRITFVPRRVRRSRWYELQVLIDGVDLCDLVRLDASTASGYAGLHFSFSDLPGLSRHLLGEPDPYLCYVGKAQVLGCECGEPACQPLVCCLQIDASTVQWSDFVYPIFGSGGRRGIRRYGGLGPFTFQRSQYEEALLAASRDVPHIDVNPQGA